MGLNSFKRRRRSCSIMSVIPIDIFASEILPRLPPTTLLRFKCLNKFFYNYISSKLFIDLQLHHSLVSHTNSPLIVFIALKARRQYLYLLDVDSPVSPARYLSLPLPFRDQHRSLRVVGCCNGLLCLNSCCSERDDTMYYAMIVNPCTGVILSDISLSTKIKNVSTNIKNVTCSGFGYHSLSKDYKLVVIEYQYHREQRSLITIYRKISVFSMKSNTWRCIETTYLGGLPMNIYDSQICVPSPRSTCALIDNYLMHWLLKSPAGKRNLVCFNLEKDQWVADIILPDYDHSIGCVFDLGVLDGRLCFSVHNYDKFNVWIMKEYGVHGSWTKFFIDIPGRDYYPIYARQHAAIKEILLVKCRRGIRTYVWYNIRDKTAKELQFSGAPDNLDPHLLCLGSLANCLGDCQTQKCKGTGERMETEDSMKIDDQVKILQANMSNNVIRS